MITHTTAADALKKSETNTNEFTEFPELNYIVQINKTPGSKLKRAIDAFNELSLDDKRSEYMRGCWTKAFQIAEREDKT